jgi:hypothetical protein
VFYVRGIDYVSRSLDTRTCLHICSTETDQASLTVLEEMHRRQGNVDKAEECSQGAQALTVICYGEGFERTEIWKKDMLRVALLPKDGDGSSVPAEDAQDASSAPVVLSVIEEAWSSESEETATKSSVGDGKKSERPSVA